MASRDVQFALIDVVELGDARESVVEGIRDLYTEAIAQLAIAVQSGRNENGYAEMIGSSIENRLRLLDEIDRLTGQVSSRLKALNQLL